MAKRVIEIDPAIYATDFLARREMIWRGLASHGTHIKDPIAYLNRMQKKFGSIVKEAAGIAYEYVNSECLAVCEDRIDERLSAAYGWTTIQAWRMESLESIKKDMKGA